MKKSFQGYPRGWFIIATSEELPQGKVLPMEYFGRQLVAFRGESGDVKVLDAFCPHLGAHLGHGGQVQGDTLVCPFHSWRFDGAGTCVEIPYCDEIPTKAKLRAWTTCEVNDLVFIWHDWAHGAPDYEIPVIPEIAESDWTDWHSSVMEIATHPKEIVENVVDKAHFPTVHRTQVVSFENEFDGHRATQRTHGIATPAAGGRDEFKITATYHGPGIQISHMDGYLKSILYNAHTPIGPNRLHLRFGVALQISGGDAARTEKFSKMYCDNLRNGFLEDVQIWEHKLYRDPPVLCRGDGPIMKLRKWYGQFYEA
jgi:3-ketosteroid 9alpha-monooxygenase subunit A